MLAIAVIGILLPLLGQPSCVNGKVVMRQSNMRMIATAMRNYVEDHDGQLVPPEQWHEIMDPWLRIERDDPIYFPDYDSQFQLLPIPWEDNHIPYDLDDPRLVKIPFMFEEQSLTEGVTSVAFWGGTVRALTDKDFAERVDMTGGVRIGVQVSRNEGNP